MLKCCSRSFDHSRVDALTLLIGSTSYNYQTTHITSTPNNGDDGTRVWFERRDCKSGTFVDSCGDLELGVGKSHVQVIFEHLERNADCNKYSHNSDLRATTTTTTYNDKDDHSTTSHVQPPWRPVGNEFPTGRYGHELIKFKTEFVDGSSRAHLLMNRHIKAPVPAGCSDGGAEPGGMITGHLL